MYTSHLGKKFSDAFKKFIVSGLLVVSSTNSSLITKNLSENAASSDNYPMYKLSEVAIHNNFKDGIWIVYKDGVYDITNFIQNHPGGQYKIIQAAGKNVKPFWNHYPIHYKSNQVKDILEDLRIGTLSHDEVVLDDKMVAVNTSTIMGNLPDDMDENTKLRIYDLRRNIWSGGFNGLLIGSAIGYLTYLSSQTKWLSHLKWNKNHRLGCIFVCGSFASFIGAKTTGMNVLEIEKDLPLLLRSGSKTGSRTEYNSIMDKNLKEEFERIEESFKRRAETLNLKRKEDIQEDKKKF